MNAITFTIELLQPMLATGLEGDPNAGVSLKYIPGSVLRGAVIGFFLQSQPQTDLATAERDLFFNSSVCFLNAYPLVDIPGNPLPKRSLPIPLSWHIVKDEKEDTGKSFYDFVKTTAKAQAPNDEKQFKGLRTKFFAFKDEWSSNVIKTELKTRISVHTRRNAAKGRATNEDGDVFRYESVETGTKFGGAIIGEDLNLLKRIKACIENRDITVGGSRTGGYGRARIQDISEEADWKETNRRSVSDTNEIPSGEFTVTLLSNALVRDKNGQLQSELLAESLGLTDGDIKLLKDKTYKKTELIGGFNRKWGLPLPQQISIKAGSVFTFEANNKIERSKIDAWLKNGTGERRLDGFGRIAVNLHNHPTLTFSEESKKEFSAVPLSSTFSVQAGQTIVDRIAKQRLQAELVDKVGAFSIPKPPKNSQISRLRIFTREVLRNSEITTKEKARDKFTEGFFKQLKKTALEQFHSAIVRNFENKDKGNLEKWICDVLSDADFFANQNIALGKDEKKVTSNDAHLSLEFRLKLIDGVLEKAAKERKSNEQS